MPNASSRLPVRLRVWPGAVCDRIRAPLLLSEGGEHLSYVATCRLGGRHVRLRFCAYIGRVVRVFDEKRYVIRLTACRDVGDSGVLRERQYGAEVYVCGAGWTGQCER